MRKVLLLMLECFSRDTTLHQQPLFFFSNLRLRKEFVGFQMVERKESPERPPPPATRANTAADELLGVQLMDHMGVSRRSGKYLRTYGWSR